MAVTIPGEKYRKTPAYEERLRLASEEGIPLIPFKSDVEENLVPGFSEATKPPPVIGGPRRSVQSKTPNPPSPSDVRHFLFENDKSAVRDAADAVAGHFRLDDPVGQIVDVVDLFTTRKGAEVVASSSINPWTGEGVADFLGLRPKTFTEWTGFEDSFWQNVKNGKYAIAGLQLADAGMDIAVVGSMLLGGVLAITTGGASVAGAGGVNALAKTLDATIDRAQQARRVAKDVPIKLGEFDTTSVETILETAKRQGGYTVDLATGKVPDSGIVVSMKGGMRIPAGVDPTPDDLLNFVRANRQKLKGKVFGIWADGNGDVYLDINKILPEEDIEGAIRLGMRNEQLAIYSPARGEVKIGNWKHWLATKFQDRLEEQREVGAQYLKETQEPITGTSDWWPIKGKTSDEQTAFERIWGREEIENGRIPAMLATLSNLTDPRENIRLFSKYMQRRIKGEDLIQPNWRMPELEYEKLPMDVQTRMARAAEQGFTLPGFHATRRAIPKYTDLSEYAKVVPAGDGFLGYNIVFTKGFEDLKEHQRIKSLDQFGVAPHHIADGEGVTWTNSFGTEDAARDFLKKGAGRADIMEPFTQFNPDKGGQLGVHFGTNPAQALSRSKAWDSENFPAEYSRTYPVMLKAENPVRIRDVGNFRPQNVIEELERIGLLKKTSKLFKERFEAKDSDIRRFLERKGYDSIVYLNRAEGTGPMDIDAAWTGKWGSPDEDFLKAFPHATDAYILWKPEQWRSTSSAFDPLHVNATDDMLDILDPHRTLGELPPELRDWNRNAAEETKGIAARSGILMPKILKDPVDGDIFINPSRETLQRAVEGSPLKWVADENGNLFVGRAAQMTHWDIYDRMGLRGTEEAGTVYRFNDQELGEMYAASAKWAAQSNPKTIKLYKLFDLKHEKDGTPMLYPTQVTGAEAVPIGQWLQAEAHPTKGLAPRFGWHAGEAPISTRQRTKTPIPHRADGRVWAEVEFKANRDLQEIANASPTKDIRNEIPNGFYRFTEPSSGDQWVIGGEMKVNRILSDKEVKDTLVAMGRDEDAIAEAYPMITEAASFPSFYKGGSEMPLEKSRTKAGYLQKAAEAADPIEALTSKKFHSMAAATRGNKEMQDNMVVVLDTWWRKLATDIENGVVPPRSGQLKGQEYDDIVDEVKKAALRFGEDPAEFSAKVWVGMRETAKKTGMLYGEKAKVMPSPSYGLEATLRDLLKEKAAWVSELTGVKVTPGQFEMMLKAGDANLLSIALTAPLARMLYLQYMLDREGAQMPVDAQPEAVAQ